MQRPSLASSKKNILSIPMHLIDPDPNQPRKAFDEEKLRELAANIEEGGLVQPILVRKHPNDPERFMIIAGERRWRATRLLQKETIDAVFEEREYSQGELFFRQLSENFGREELNLVERAEYLDQRIQELKAQGIENSMEVLAKEIGVTKSWVSKARAVLRYDERIRSLVRDGRLKNYGTMRKISKLRGSKRELAIELIENQKWNEKEFFGRKPKTDAADGEGLSAQDAAPSEKKQKLILFRIKPLTRKESIALIEATAFRPILAQSDPDWRDARDELFQGYLNEFRNWVLTKDDHAE